MTMMNIFTGRFATLILCLSLLTFSVPAYAKKVYSPIVEEGEIEIEYQLDVVVDNDPAQDGSAKHQFELEFGVTDRWSTALYGVFTKKPGQGFSYDRVKWENIYQLFEKGERWLDAALYFEYQIPDGAQNKPDVFEFKLLLEKGAGEWLHTANLILKKEVGVLATKGTISAYAWRSRWNVSRHFRPAIEVFGTLGEIGNFDSPFQQSHLAGPVVSGKIGHEFKYELGYLFGLTSGSVNGNIKLILAYEF